MEEIGRDNKGHPKDGKKTNYQLPLPNLKTKIGINSIS
jgi:hypothetical protein